jgi:predicted PurR-regulated permease PerM
MAYWARVTLTVAGALALLAAAWRVRNVLLLVLVAAVLAVGLDPQVRWLQRRRLSRGWAVTAILLLSVGLVVLFAWLVIPAAVRQTQQLASHTPQYLDRLEHATGFLGTLQQRYDLAQRLRETTTQLPAFALKKVPGVTASAGSTVFNALTVTVLTVYFLVGLPRGQAAATALLAGQGQHADRNVRILEESLGRIGGYVSGNLLVSVIAGTSAFVVLEILHVPFAAALGLWVAIADLIPSVGATLGAVLCVVVALFSSGAHAVVVAVYFVVYQRVENYFILPRIMTKAIDLSAPTVIVTLLIGASLAGLEGALVALPIAAAVKVAIREVWPAGRTTPVTRRRPPNRSAPPARPRARRGDGQPAAAAGAARPRRRRGSRRGRAGAEQAPRRRAGRRPWRPAARPAAPRRRAAGACRQRGGGSGRDGRPPWPRVRLRRQPVPAGQPAPRRGGPSAAGGDAARRAGRGPGRGRGGAGRPPAQAGR